MKRLRARTQLGPGGKVYVVVAAVLLVIAVYTQFNLLVLSFGLMIGGLICSLILSWLMLRNITVHRVLPGHGVVEDAMIIRYRVCNGNRRLAAFALQIEELTTSARRRRRGAGNRASANPCSGPQGWILHVGPNQTVQCEATWWPTRRGAVRFDRFRLSTSFPFGIVRRHVTFSQDGKALVYPRLYRINRRVLYELSCVDAAGNRRRQSGGGHDEIFGLRKYREGDSLKTIDWRHTAKTGELVCRDMTRPRPPKIMLGLDLTDEGPPGDARTSGSGGDDLPSRASVAAEVEVERAVSLAASIVCDAYLRGFQVGLSVTGAPCDSFAPHHSLPHRTRLLEALATLDVNGQLQPINPRQSAPTVIVRAGRGDGRGAHARMILGVAQLEQYVDAIKGSSARILERRPHSVRRHELMRAEHSWA